MVRQVHRLQRRAGLAVATLCLALSGCGADDSSVGGPNKPEHPVETLTAGQIVTVVATINQGEMKQVEATLDRLEDEEIRDYGEKLLVDHRTSDGELTRLMGMLGLTQQSSGLQAEVEQLGQRMNQVLEQEPAERIAPMFLDVQMLMHRKAVEAVDKLLMQAQQPELRAYLETYRVTLTQHLNEAAKLRTRFPDPQTPY